MTPTCIGFNQEFVATKLLCTHLKRDNCRHSYAYLVPAVVGKVRIVKDSVNCLTNKEGERGLRGYI